MNEPVDSSQCHGGVGEDPVPCAERLVRGNKHGSSLISGTDELEQDAGLGLILGDIGEIVKDEQVELVELLDCAFEDEIAPCLLELLDEIRGSGKEDTVSVLDQGEANCGGEMALAAAWWAEDTRGDREVGGTVKARFTNNGQEIGAMEMKLEQLIPGELVLWRFIAGPAEWIGTHARFVLKQEGDYCIVLFTHEGWKERVEFTSGSRWSTRRPSCWTPCPAP